MDHKDSDGIEKNEIGWRLETEDVGQPVSDAWKYRKDKKTESKYQPEDGIHYLNLRLFQFLHNDEEDQGGANDQNDTQGDRHGNHLNH